ncbi:MAG TPA: MBL fold metallo-hydrolase [Ktedonobacteraceae bacterium]|jgi:glyoxylase-like metal-dependent hydrolase (beta-lactamase superfamily II)|nr:MBL fold metallo-hydrolase [Ktedonobacteraceae bacterium]
MHMRDWARVGALSLGLVGLGWAARGFLPPAFSLDPPQVVPESLSPPASLPDIEVTFLRCGLASIPECVAVRGSRSFAPRAINYGAVLIRHPRATFLYDTGLCSDIYLFLKHQSFLFHQTLARFTFEHSLSDHLTTLGLRPRDLEFAFLSHLHWDHVSGIPDIPGVPLRINRVEYDAAASTGLLEHRHGLVQSLLGDANPVELFDCAGPAYEGFRSSLDLFGDGSVIAVPLPGHTAGNTGLFINRAHGPRLFLLGDAVWLADHYQRPSIMHPFFWSQVTSDDATARQTILSLYHYARRHPEVPLIAMHDADLQAAFMETERLREVQTT